jgi:tetratricopeptide (TPR) repeat protein
VGGHRIRATKEGYKEFVQQVEIIPYASENVHSKLEPLVPHLTNEQLAEIESWRKKLEAAQKENIFLPPPEDYNALFFANKILSIDPANAYALEVKNRLAEITRRSADLAYAREDWLEAEKHYKSLALLLPDDISINERLTDIAAKIDASMKDRDKQISEWTAKAEVAMKAGNLVPPEKENALEALRNIERLDRKNTYAKEALARLKETLQNRGDTKISSGDWQGARNDFKIVLQYFPEDDYSKTRLTAIEGKLGEATLAEQQRAQKMQEEQQQQSKQRLAALRQSALNSYRSGSHAKAVSEWQEYLKFEPNSDEAYFYLGSSYQEQKQYDTAILNFEKCLSINPNNGPAHLNLGILYDHHRNNVAKAIEHLRKVKELGGVEKYAPEKVQTMIQGLQDRAALDGMQKTGFPAEHKHVFSTCRGDIRVSESGIEFKTKETDHSFFESYANLRTFAIQGDDLTVRTQNNKKYNFRFLNPGDGDRVRRIAARYTLVTD